MSCPALDPTGGREPSHACTAAPPQERYRERLLAAETLWTKLGVSVATTLQDGLLLPSDRHMPGESEVDGRRRAVGRTTTMGAGARGLVA